MQCEKDLTRYCRLRRWKKGPQLRDAGSFWKMEKPEAVELPLAWCRRAQQGSPEDIWSFERVVELRATSERRRGTA